MRFIKSRFYFLFLVAFIMTTIQSNFANAITYYVDMNAIELPNPVPPPMPDDFGAPSSFGSFFSHGHVSMPAPQSRYNGRYSAGQSAASAQGTYRPLPLPNSQPQNDQEPKLAQYEPPSYSTAPYFDGESPFQSLNEMRQQNAAQASRIQAQQIVYFQAYAVMEEKFQTKMGAVSQITKRIDTVRNRASETFEQHSAGSKLVKDEDLSSMEKDLEDLNIELTSAVSDAKSFYQREGFGAVQKMAQQYIDKIDAAGQSALKGSEKIRAWFRAASEAAVAERKVIETQTEHERIKSTAQREAVALARTHHTEVNAEVHQALRALPHVSAKLEIKACEYIKSELKSAQNIGDSLVSFASEGATSVSIGVLGTYAVETARSINAFLGALADGTLRTFGSHLISTGEVLRAVYNNPSLIAKLPEQLMYQITSAQFRDSVAASIINTGVALTYGSAAEKGRALGSIFGSAVYALAANEVLASVRTALSTMTAQLNQAGLGEKLGGALHPKLREAYLNDSVLTAEWRTLDHSVESIINGVKKYGINTSNPGLVSRFTEKFLSSTHTELGKNGTVKNIQKLAKKTAQEIRRDIDTAPLRATVQRAVQSGNVVQGIERAPPVSQPHAVYEKVDRSGEVTQRTYYDHRGLRTTAEDLSNGHIQQLDPAAAAREASRIEKSKGNGSSLIEKMKRTFGMTDVARKDTTHSPIKPAASAQESYRGQQPGASSASVQRPYLTGRGAGTRDFIEKTVEDFLKNTKVGDRRGFTDQRIGKGGYDGMYKDFDSLVRPESVKPIPGMPGGQSGVSKAGDNISVRPSSKGASKANNGPPTLQIDRPDGIKVKVRY